LQNGEYQKSEVMSAYEQTILRYLEKCGSGKAQSESKDHTKEI